MKTELQEIVAGRLAFGVDLDHLHFVNPQDVGDRPALVRIGMAGAAYLETTDSARATEVGDEKGKSEFAVAMAVAVAAVVCCACRLLRALGGLGKGSPNTASEKRGIVWQHTTRSLPAEFRLLRGVAFTGLTALLNY